MVMPRVGGMETAARAEGSTSDLTLILLTAQGTVETAVEAIKEGAYDYLSKPVDPQRLQILLQKAVERQDTLREVRHLRRQLREAGTFGRIVGNSPTHPVGLPRHRAGGADPGVGADLGGVGHGQGADRADDSRAEPAVVVPVRGDQLRGDSRDAARERDLRPREGRVHRRARSPDRRVRAGASRHAVPRRDRRDDAGDAGQAAARAAGADVPAAGRPAGAVGGRAGDRGDQREPDGGGASPASCAKISSTG